ncbi:MAG: hypothetical protein SFT68_03380 [Rickettsiaceae bacterium]|nr:hypothetical protein [Rickettsiaceae bacterium]
MPGYINTNTIIFMPLSPEIATKIYDKSSANLNLYWKEIGPEGAKALVESLQHNNSIKSLNLSGNNLGPEGAKYLEEILSKNRAIVDLNLSDNYLGPESAIAISNVLEKNETITSLDLSGNNLGPEGLIAIASKLISNNSIVILDLNNNAPQEQSFEALCAIANALESNYIITDLATCMFKNLGDRNLLQKIHTILSRNKIIFIDTCAKYNTNRSLETLSSLEFNALKSNYAFFKNDPKKFEAVYKHLTSGATLLIPALNNFHEDMLDSSYNKGLLEDEDDTKDSLDNIEAQNEGFAREGFVFIEPEEYDAYLLG